MENRLIQVEYIMANDPEHARAWHAPEYEHGSAFINGDYCAVDSAAVPILDVGFIHADAAYDVVSASKGYIFRLDDHLERFHRSCEAFRLASPYNKAETAEILQELVRLAGTRDAYIWWCVTRGVMPEGSRRGDPEAYDNCFYAFAIPYLFIADDATRNRGFDLVVSRQFIRIPPRAVDPRAKNFHWMDMKLSLFEARDEGGDFSVLTDAEGYLAESPGANIFLLKGDTLYTPDDGCLEGITRQTTLELARELGLSTRVERVHAEQLLTADEVFITSTAGGIMPVGRVDGELAGGREGPGEWTCRLHDLYWTKRWQGWLGTPVELLQQPAPDSRLVRDTQQSLRADQAHHIHPFSYPDRVRAGDFRRVIQRCEGVYQIDNRGARYIDAVSGLACVNIGYGREEMAETMAEATRTLSFHPSFWECVNPYSAALVEQLNRVTPDQMAHFFFANSGSEANDTAIKLVRWFWKLQGKPDKTHIISREMAYHGMNLLTASLTGLAPCHPQFGLPVAGVSHIMAPWSWAHGTGLDDEDFGIRAAGALEQEILRIGPDKVGAFIGEPVQATGCMIMPPRSYWPEIQRICRQYDVLLIADEVVTGFGRSGEWFAQQYFGFEADITVMAKGITSAYFPVSAVALSPRVGEPISGDSGELYHGYTCSAHPVGAAVALKNIEILEREGLVTRVREQLGPLFREHMDALREHPLVGEVRCLGLSGAIQLTADERNREFFPEALAVDATVACHTYERGVIVRDLGGDTLGVSPPFITSPAQLQQVFDALSYGLDRTLADLGRQVS